MPEVLIATDADWIRDDVDAALGGSGMAIARVHRGQDVLPAILELQPQVVVVDMQIGNMGGIAVCKEIRHREGAGSLDDTAVILLLDREADRWLAQQADPDAILVKPLDMFKIREAFDAVMAEEGLADTE